MSSDFFFILIPPKYRSWNICFDSCNHLIVILIRYFCFGINQMKSSRLQ